MPLSLNSAWQKQVIIYWMEGLILEASVAGCMQEGIIWVVKERKWFIQGLLRPSHDHGVRVVTLGRSSNLNKCKAHPPTSLCSTSIMAARDRSCLPQYGKYFVLVPQKDNWAELLRLILICTTELWTTATVTQTINSVGLLCYHRCSEVRIVRNNTHIFLHWRNDKIP